VTAMVIKYSDNILKGFATSLSIVISFLASVALFDFQMSITFALGSVIVLIATWLYNQHPTRVNIVISKEPWSWIKAEKSKEDISLRAPPLSTLQFDGLASSSTSSLVSLSSLSSGTPAMSDPESRPFIR
jgi:solute carrier family 35 (UDP-sugar transporter), member A1/2/3